MARVNQADALAWAQECSRRAGAAGIGFRFDPKCAAPETDGKTVICPPLPADATPEDFQLLRGNVVHECGHIIRNDAFKILKREKVAGGSNLWACFNIVEDAAQERESAMRWKGDRAALADSHEIIIKRQAKRAAEAAAGGETQPPDTHKHFAALAMSLKSADDWSTAMRSMAGEYARNMDTVAPGTVALAAELEGEGWHERMRKAGDCEGAWQVARELCARLFPEKSEEENKQSAEEGKPGEDGEPGEGEGKAKAEGQGRIPWELIFHSEHAAEVGGKSVVSIDWNGKHAGPAPVYFTEQRTCDVQPRGDALERARKMYFPAALVQEVRRLLQAQARIKWNHEKLDGRLDRRNLTRLVMPRVGDGTYNRSVFQQRQAKPALDVALQILVDSSGSMAGAGKYLNAAQASMSLYDLAQVALRIPVELLGFTYTAGQPLYYLFKEFEERRTEREHLAAKLLEVQNSHGLQGNADGDALLWAVARLRKQRAARKVMIVLSDGCPADCAPGGDYYTNLICAVDSVRASGVELYGIGIMDSNVKRFYSADAPVIQRPEQIGPALIEVLKDLLQRQRAPGR